MVEAIILREEERQAVVDFHNRNIERIKEVMQELSIEMAESMQRISELTGGKGDTYDLGAPLWKRVAHILKTTGCICTTKEIAGMLCKIEDKIKHDPRDITSAISATLKPKIDKGDTFGRMDIDGELYYGLIEWFGKDGIALSRYMGVM